jgi:dihydroorotase
MKTIYAHFRIVDAERDVEGALVVEDGRIKTIIPAERAADPAETAAESRALLFELGGAGRFIDGAKLKDPASHDLPVLLPAFIDLHAHFRDPGDPQKETLESASLAAVKGGYTTLVCMANTNPVTDTLAAAAALKARSDTLGLIDLYPAMSLTKGMKGEELSEIAYLAALRHHAGLSPGVLLLSEDGKDITDDAILVKVLCAAAQAGLPVSCHCDRDGENAATARILQRAGETGARIHIAHVSTKEAAAMVAAAKREYPGQITAEATPHHFFLTRKRADELGRDTFGKVAPPLRSEADRDAVFEALLNGPAHGIDAIATDHAPHTEADKKAGAPGFSGLETAFAVSCTTIVGSGEGDLCSLSRLMSAAPARILGLDDRGTLASGKRADLVIVNPEARWTVDKAAFRSRGKNTPFDGMELSGIVLSTILGGQTVYERPRGNTDLINVR